MCAEAGCGLLTTLQMRPFVIRARRHPAISVHNVMTVFDMPAVLRPTITTLACVNASVTKHAVDSGCLLFGEGPEWRLLRLGSVRIGDISQTYPKPI